MEELQTPYITPVLNEVGYYFSLPTYYLPKFVVRRSSRGVVNGCLMYGTNNLEIGKGKVSLHALETDEGKIRARLIIQPTVGYMKNIQPIYQPTHIIVSQFILHLVISQNFLVLMHKRTISL